MEIWDAYDKDFNKIKILKTYVRVRMHGIDASGE